MSKELEYIQRQINIVKQQVKGSNMKIIVTDAVTKHQYDYYERELQTLESIEKALQRLESIENVNPSEALECLEEWKYQINSYIDCSLEQRDIDNECYNHLIEELEQYYTTIKQALLKAQEPKHYLKWEDLEFTRDEKVMLVKMGDTVYKVLYRCCDGIEEVQLLSEDEKLLILNLIGKYKDNIQVFNDLHLERVEE